jgi:hypothetical protein
MNGLRPGCASVLLKSGPTTAFRCVGKALAYPEPLLILWSFRIVH